MTGNTPQTRVAAACRRLGRSEVIRRCEAILDGGDADIDFVLLLGGEPARRLLADGLPGGQSYWLRVWAARPLWAGVDEPTSSLRVALEDDSWRVREMACKVVARHRIADLFDEVAPLQDDPVARVRVAATRAVVRIAEAAQDPDRWSLERTSGAVAAGSRPLEPPKNRRRLRRGR